MSTIIQKLKLHNYQWKYKLIICLPIFLLLIVMDWITKGVVASKFSQNDLFTIMPGFLSGGYIINIGAAYGFNASNLTLTVSLASLVTILFAIFFIFVNDKKWIIVITFILAGSFANLFGRIWAPPTIDTNQRFGVIDFLKWDFNLFNSTTYIFNLADLWVNCGIILAIVCLLVEILKFCLIYFAKRKQLIIDDEDVPSSLLEIIKLFRKGEPNHE